MLDSLLVTTDQASLFETFNHRVKIDFEELRFQLLDLYDLVYCFPQIELGAILPKFTLLQLRIVQNVVDQEAKDLRTRFLDLGSLRTFSVDGDQFRFELERRHVDV